MATDEHRWSVPLWGSIGVHLWPSVFICGLMIDDIDRIGENVPPPRKRVDECLSWERFAPPA